MKFEIIGEEIRFKEIKSHGTGGIIYVPKMWAGEKVAIIRGVVEETENLSRTLDGKRNVVYSYYAGDILHRGHIEMMRNSKRVAGSNGISVVGILTDDAIFKAKSRKPTISFDERITLADSIRFNDVVLTQDTYSPLKNLERIRPDIAMESSSHKKEDIEEVRKFMKEMGGKVFINPYYPGKSSTKIKKKIKEEQ